MYASVCFVNGLTRFSLVAEVREQLVMLLLSRSDYQMYAPGSKIVGFESLVKLLPDIEPKEAKLLNRGVKAHKPEAVEFWLHERLPLILEILTLVDFETLLEIEADTSTA